MAAREAGRWKSGAFVIKARPDGCVASCVTQLGGSVIQQDGGGRGGGLGSRPRDRVEGAAGGLDWVLRARCDLQTLPRTGEDPGSRERRGRDHQARLGSSLGASVLYFGFLRLRFLQFQVLLTLMGTFLCYSVAAVVLSPRRKRKQQSLRLVQP